MENTVAVPQKVKHDYYMSQWFYWVYIREKQTWSQKNLYIDFHSRIIHNSQKLQIAHKSFSGKMFNVTVVHPYHGILLNSILNTEIVNSIYWIVKSGDTCSNFDELQRHCAEWDKTVSKGYRPDDSTYLIFMKRPKL